MGTQPRKYLEIKKIKTMYKISLALFIKRKNKKLLKYPAKKFS